MGCPDVYYFARSDAAGPGVLCFCIAFITIGMSASPLGMRVTSRPAGRRVGDAATDPPCSNRLASSAVEYQVICVVRVAW
jgi:hypothetical protein